MRRLSKDGKKSYNVASERGWGDYPRICSGCTVKPRITLDALWFDNENGVPRTWHFDCKWGEKHS